MNNTLIDKIVGLILSETKYSFVFDYKGRLYCKTYIPSYPMIIDSQDMSDIEEFLSYVHSDDFSMGENDIDYINYNYGIDDLNIIKAIWNKYYIVLYTKIKDEYEEIWKNRNKDNSLNESMNRLDQLVEYVSNNLYQDTKYRFMYDYDDEIRVIITWPTEDGEQDYSIWDMEEWDVFYYDDKDAQFLDKHYGITDEDLVQKIFDAYIQKLAPVIYEKMEYLDNNREES